MSEEIIGEIPEPVMNQPATSELDPWTSFPSQEYDFIEDDFVHENKFSLKTQLRHPRGGVEIEHKVDQSKSGNLSFNHESKFWLGLPDNRSMFCRLREKNMKLHYDNGTRKIFGKLFNFYGTLSASHKFEDLSWRFGLSHNSENVHSDFRVKISPRDSSPLKVSARNVYTQGKWTFGYVGMLDVNKHVLACSNLLLGCKVDDRSQVFLRGENEHFRRSNPSGPANLFDYYILDAISRVNEKTTIGAEVAFQNEKGRMVKWSQLAVERVVREGLSTKWKVKMEHGGDIEVAGVVKKAFPKCLVKDGSFSFGILASNPFKNRLLQWGTQLQFNV